MSGVTRRHVGLWAALAALCLAGPALAQGEYCAQMRAQLASVGGNSRDPNAANLQALYRELSIAQGQANAYGCRQGFFIFGGGGGPQCAAILSRVSSLQQTINSLQRNSFFDGSTGLADRIRQDMARAGCDLGGASVGQGRTVCVRTCDGFYFPISFAADRSRFKRDEAACQAMYPPGQAVLFVDGDADGDSDDMVTLDGKRYRDQPYALAYRNSFNASCPAPRASITGPATLAAARPVVPVPVPMPKQNRGEDPDTQANLAVDFSPAPVIAGGGKTAAASTVRVVGPSYFYSFGDEAPAPDTPGIAPKAANETRPDAATAAGQPVLR